MAEQDVAYYERRLNEERERAAQCPDMATAQVHRDLATRYAALIEEVGAARTEPAH